MDDGVRSCYEDKYVYYFNVKHMQNALHYTLKKFKKSKVMRIGPSFSTACKLVNVNFSSLRGKLNYLSCLLVSAKSLNLAYIEIKAKVHKFFNSL